MRQSFYRVLISIFAAWAGLSIPSVLLSSVTAGEPVHPSSILLAIGIALLPISVIGLWKLRLWGFVSLLLGFSLIMATYPPAIVLHAICIALTVLRYCFAQRETGTVHPFV